MAERGTARVGDPRQIEPTDHLPHHSPETFHLEVYLCYAFWSLQEMTTLNKARKKLLNPRRIYILSWESVADHMISHRSGASSSSCSLEIAPSSQLLLIPSELGEEEGESDQPCV